MALAVLLAGCTLPWQEEEQDPAALGPPEPISVVLEHDYLGNGRNVPVRMNTSTGTVTIRLEIRQQADHPACMPDRTPPYIQVFKPLETPFFRLTAPTQPESANATADGSGNCSAVLERTVERERGVWRVEFLGSGNFTGTATFTGAGAPS